MTSSHPLLATSELPYGLPDYSAIDDADYLPAFRQGFAEREAEIADIAKSAEPATFENTLEALERSGELLERVAHAFFTVSSAHATRAIQQIDEAVAPLMAAHNDRVLLNSALYERISSVARQLDDLPLTDEQRRLTTRWHEKMTRAGAALGVEAKQRLTWINGRLAELTTTFEKNLLADTNELAVLFDDVADLDGLSASELSSARDAASARGIADGYLITLPLFTGHPLLASLTRAQSRERILAASRARGSRGNDNDNSAVLLEIVRLRAERAALLGFDTHAAYVTAGETAQTPEAVRTRLRELAAPAARNAQAEKRDLEAIAGRSIDAHDWTFFTEQERTRRFDVDAAALRPWFEAERVLWDGVFYAAHRLYGVTFIERHDLPGYHPSVRFFDVLNEDGSPQGMYVLDLFTRDTKRGGAWMNSIVAQSHLRGTLPVVVNNLNVSKPSGDEPVLLTHDEVETLFHEFGHALHGLFATVTYPFFAGTAVGRDFVEFPSQVNEMWVMHADVLPHYAKHVTTGEPLPHDVIERLTNMGPFGQGFATSEYLAAAWLDHSWHSVTQEQAEKIDDVAAFEAAALADIGLDEPAIPSRYSSTYFQHIFAGGYSAAYYSYIWSEVLDADTVSWFEENGGLTRENGDRFRQRLLGVGGSKDPLEAYRDFRGRDAKIDPLLKRRGLEA
ncbi:M3 family metallopeptidase [Microbacterium amylolyticum]|uniref:Peptidyl-dipeptidase Dcp n=1 Tax=Microbacterium amylolyticum TaxID=936337 RepID=A0ABS4ZER8_9MICO|nr:M3 family metallopeptidase [Microbacterium amylolyticum]MBP2435707.1 peptidyl-dipeptidase Dcp [Microbacterium amylolyticum]